MAKFQSDRSKSAAPAIGGTKYYEETVGDYAIAGDFEEAPFAEGRFRVVYRGFYTSPSKKKGLPCVVKKEKVSKFWTKDSWMMTLQVYSMARKLAEEFNKTETSNKTVEYVDTFHVKSDARKYQGGPYLNEDLLVEDYVPGHFKKWCSNSGFISEESKTLPALMHWSWCHSKGKTMIADLQGIQTSYKYILTDPVMMSNTQGGKYGPTDTGIEGITMFFLMHKCSELCRNLPRPTNEHIFSIISPREKGQMQKVQISTAYSCDLVIHRDNIKRLMEFYCRIAEKY